VPSVAAACLSVCRLQSPVADAAAASAAAAKSWKVVTMTTAEMSMRTEPGAKPPVSAAGELHGGRALCIAARLAGRLDALGDLIPRQSGGSRPPRHGSNDRPCLTL